MMKRKLGFAHLTLTGALLLTSASAGLRESRADMPPPCQRCPSIRGLYGTIELGAAYFSDNVFNFGDFRGLEDKGLSPIGHIELRYRGKAARYWQMTGFDLGRDGHALSMKGGRQGKYKIWLGYDQIPRRFFDTAETPYRGTGSENLTLPAGWATSTITSGMSALSGGLQPFSIQHDRENVRAGFTVSPSDQFEYTIRYRHEARDGLRLGSGNFLSFSTVLPEPLNLTTDEIEASLRYTTDQGQLRLAYYGSFFNNNERSLSWDNPFTPLSAGSNRGQLALPPDNQAHRIALSGGYQLTGKTRVSGSISAGQMSQDETFIPATVNSNIAPGPLPGTSPDAKVKTTRIHFNLFSMPTRKLNVRLNYTFNDRDNKTPRKTFNVVESDTFVSGPRTNRPYSYRKQDLDLKSAYRLRSNLKLSGGASLDRVKRDFQERPQTDEATLWFKLKASDKSGRGFGSLKISHADRNGNRYALPDELKTVENPLLRKYNLADRKRNLVTVHIAATPMDWVTLGFTTEITTDNYNKSAVGLTDSSQRHLAVDLSFALPRNIRLYTLLSREQISSRQNGSQGFGLPDWFAENRDVVNTAGAGLFIPRLLNRCDLGFDFNYAASNGQNKVTQAGGTTESFPNLKNRLTHMKLYLNYRYNPRIHINTFYQYEKQRQNDWTHDGVAVDTVANALVSGVSSPNYEAYLTGLSLRYFFSNP
ncbi:MAG: MtrB/PioB family decaheme-associated outer membrane protein [Nitrospiria bacterium]